MRATRVAFLVIGVVASLLAPLLAASAASSAPERGLTGHLLYETTAFAATNVQRATRDRVTVDGSSCLQRFANQQANRMADQQRMFHQKLGPVLDDCPFTLVGENVAAGFTSGKATVTAWMKSTSHRANILERRYRRMAIAARKGEDGVWYVAQVFGGKA